jgi:2-haloacid dehalogenase
MSPNAAAEDHRVPAELTTIAFDAYGTLFDVFSVTALCERTFPGRGEALAHLWRAKQLQYSLLRSVMGEFRDFWELTADGLEFATRSLGLRLDEDTRARLMDAYLRLAAFPDVAPGLARLKQQGLRLAVLSNGAPAMLHAAVAAAGLTASFDAILSVNDVGVFKPSRRVYALVGERMQVPTDRIGFVSSNSWDVSGAGAAGLYTFWIQRTPGEPEEQLGHEAREVVASITELATRLQRRR